MASDIADGSPNTARSKTAKSTSGEAADATARDTVVATVADSVEDRASDDKACMERSPDTAHDMNVEAADETTCKTVGTTMSEAADEAASGATKKIASERAADAPCEYPVYVRDYAQSEDRLFADDFYGFLEKF